MKFAVEDGHVTLRVSQVGRAEVGGLSDSRPGRSVPLPDNEFVDFLEISVTDNGIGISGRELERLFQPFSQIDSGLARKFEGTGLGLSMVKQLAGLHGGAVAVESAVGEGSCFTVWLPLRAVVGGALMQVKQPSLAPLTGPSGAPTAMVVEGDLKSAELIRFQLEAKGFVVLHALSAEAGLVLAAERPLLSVITLDILLPDMDGWEFLRRIKQIPALARIPVVIVSILATDNRGSALGAAAVIQKPMSRHELDDALVRLNLFKPHARTPSNAPAAA